MDFKYLLNVETDKDIFKLYGSFTEPMGKSNTIHTMFEYAGLYCCHIYARDGYNLLIYFSSFKVFLETLIYELKYTSNNEDFNLNNFMNLVMMYHNPMFWNWKLLIRKYDWYNGKKTQCIADGVYYNGNSTTEMINIAIDKLNEFNEYDYNDGITYSEEIGSCYISEEERSKYLKTTFNTTIDSTYIIDSAQQFNVLISDPIIYHSKFVCDVCYTNKIKENYLINRLSYHRLAHEMYFDKKLLNNSEIYVLCDDCVKFETNRIMIKPAADSSIYKQINKICGDIDISTQPSDECYYDGMDLVDYYLSQNKSVEDSPNNFTPGKFEYIQTRCERERLAIVWKSITELNLWDFMKKDINSYTLDDELKIGLIWNNIVTNGCNQFNSANKFCISIREMQYIALNGEENYREKYRNKLN